MKNRFMEKRVPERRILSFIGILALFLLLLSGCGGKEEGESENKFNEVLTESEQLPDVRDNVDASEREGYLYLGSQIRDGERLQIWGAETEEGGKVYLHRENGERELLMEDVHRFFFTGFKWWVDNEDKCFLLTRRGIARPKMDESLRPTSDFSAYEGVFFQFKVSDDEQIVDICQLEDGRYIVLSEDGEQYRFSELDPDSGRLDNVVSLLRKDFGAIVWLVSAEGNGPLVLSGNGVWEVNLTDGRTEHRVSFDGTTYELEMDEHNTREKEDFRLLEDGRIELLWSDGTVEFVDVAEVDTEREIIVLRVNFMITWLKEQVEDFNQQSEKYYVAVEEKERGEDVESYCERTDLEIGAGKGADIIVDEAANDVCSLLEKGAFADLTPFMDASGLSEEDFFPAAFSGWKDDSGIYGVRTVSMPWQFWLDQAVVGERSISNLEELTDCLLAYEEDAVLIDGYSPAGVLKFFMKRSESLCGTVDFKNGTCDFSGELFGKLLEVAKRYGYDEKRERTPVGGVVEYLNFYNFCDDAFLSKIGRVPVGFMSDDGGCPYASGFVLAINANSDKKEGAWEFLNYLLGEEVQSKFYVAKEDAMRALYEYFPINRNVFEELCGRHEAVINEGVDFDSLDGYEKIHLTGLTEERKALLRETLENARPSLVRTAPLIDIIVEEARAYFSGDKSIDELRTMTENRVQLYLNEHK